MKNLRTYEDFDESVDKIRRYVKRIYSKYPDYKSNIFDTDISFNSYINLGGYKVDCFCDRHGFDIFVYDKDNKEVDELYHTDIKNLKPKIDEYIFMQESEELGIL